MKFQGDNGKTRLLKGEELNKNSLVFDVLGDLDELNSSLALARFFLKKQEYKEWILKIQNDIFAISGWIAGSDRPDLEKMIEEVDLRLEFCRGKVGDLKDFVHFGNKQGESFVNFSRAVCRRAERASIDFLKDREDRKEIMTYLNHLSKFLFFFAVFLDGKN